MLTVPRSKVVRGFSFFGVSFVYVIFEEGTDIYWARSRVLEYLNFASSRMPKGVTPQIGPDATGVGWVYQYALMAAERNLAELAHHSGLAGAVRRRQGARRRRGGECRRLREAIFRGCRSAPAALPSTSTARQGPQRDPRANMDVGGRVVELAETEFMVRGRGYLKSIADIESIVLKAQGGTPVLIKDVARVELAPDERRGVTELNGEGEVVSGIALQRYGAECAVVIAASRNGSPRSRQPAEGHRDRAGLRSLRPHPSRHRDAEHDAHRGKYRRRAGLLRVPATCEERARCHHHAAARHSHRLRVHVGARHLLQHHEPRRDRDRHRRDDRCRDRHDRERAQASGARAPDKPRTEC